MQALLVNDELRGCNSRVLAEILRESEHPSIDVREVCVADLEKSLSGDAFTSDVGIALLAVDRPALERMDSVVRSLKQAVNRLPVLSVVGNATVGDTMQLIRLGIADFITPPLRPANVIPRVCRWALPTPSEDQRNICEHLKTVLSLHRIIGRSPMFVKAVEVIPSIAEIDVGVLITGETGTGKELIARVIHYLSPRSGKPFIPVNCGALPADLVENELFGHERGAYTGAAGSARGLVSEAHGGTLFLDEVDSLPLPAQVKVLRLLQDGEYRALGSAKTHEANVRVVAAANTNLEEAIADGRLREDFYYRLNVIPLTLPPLRSRIEDIPLLADHFLEKYAREFNRPAKQYTTAAVDRLLCHDWPGNVRELEHEVERAVVLSNDTLIQPGDVLQWLQGSTTRETMTFKEAKAKAVAGFEVQFIERSLLTSRGNISKAAAAVGKHPRAYWELVQKHGIDPHRFRK